MLLIILPFIFLAGLVDSIAGGGGRPDFAEAGGKDASKIDEALKLVKDVVASKIS